MAKGGWKYQGVQLGPTNGTLAEVLVDLTKVTDAFINAGKGWSLVWDAKKISGSSSDFAIAALLQHSNGKCCLIGISNYSYQRVDRDNCANGEPGGNLWFTYGGPNLGTNLDPKSSELVTDGLYVASINSQYYKDGTTSGFYSLLHLAFRDDGAFWMVYEYKASAGRGINGFILAGDIISELQHDSDTGWLSCTAIIGEKGGSYHSSNDERLPERPDMQICTFAAAHDSMPTRRRRTEDGARIFAGQNVFLEKMYQPTITENVAWSTIHVGIQNDNLNEAGVVVGNGFKGVLDSEAIIEADHRGLTPWQRLDDGNYIYVTNGIALGWDPSNGDLI